MQCRSQCAHLQDVLSAGQAKSQGVAVGFVAAALFSGGQLFSICNSLSIGNSMERTTRNPTHAG
jgi:hypothetical protein